jgi:hypothetical protein
MISGYNGFCSAPYAGKKSFVNITPSVYVIHILFSSSRLSAWLDGEEHVNASASYEA